MSGMDQYSLSSEVNSFDYCTMSGMDQYSLSSEVNSFDYCTQLLILGCHFLQS